jgi:hypothetical protein
LKTSRQLQEKTNAFFLIKKLNSKTNESEKETIVFFFYRKNQGKKFLQSKNVEIVFILNVYKWINSVLIIDIYILKSI